MLTGDYNPLRAEGRDQIVVAGSFAPNGSSALSSASTYGKGFTVAYTSTGLYTISFDNHFQRLVGAGLALMLNATDDVIINLGAYTAGSGTTKSTITIMARDISGAGLVDIAANANNRIYFNFVFSNSSLTP